MRLESTSDRPWEKLLELTLDEAFQLQAALTAAMRSHVKTGGMVAGRDVGPLTVVHNCNLMPGSLTVLVHKD